jgi:glutamate N-acetyltransferase / amino-acid N-acetyltransferase
MPTHSNIDGALAWVDGGVTAAKGFAAAGVSAGLKKTGKRDVAIVCAEVPVPSAAVFTRSSTAAAPVIVSREHIESGLCRAIVVNSGNANACTGEQGLADARSMAAVTARSLGCDPADVIVASTGVIGVAMPMDLVAAGVAEAAAALEFGSGATAAEAIMTTDTFPKESAVSVEADGHTFTVGGIAKGSGMIHPNMATMLSFVTTDAPLTPEACDVALRTAISKTFNRITVDGDTSTNDMVVLMASGAAGGESIGPDSASFAQVSRAVEHVCGELARMIVRDGEGATKFVSVIVRGALTEADAEAAAFSIATSPLFKTAIFGRDANWGRVAMAVGKSSATVDAPRLEVRIAGIQMCVDGTGLAFDEQAAAAALEEDEIEVVADLHLGEASATVWTCDLSYEYVRINGEYRS